MSTIEKTGLSNPNNRFQWFRSIRRQRTRFPKGMEGSSVPRDSRAEAIRYDRKQAQGKSPENSLYLENQ